MPRITPLALEDAPESVRQLLAPDRPNQIALLFGHAETNWPRVADPLLSILSQQELAPKLRDLAILRVAGAVYEALAKLMNALQLESAGPIDPAFAAAVNRGSVARVPAESGD